MLPIRPGQIWIHRHDKDIKVIVSELAWNNNQVFFKVIDPSLKKYTGIQIRVLDNFRRFYQFSVYETFKYLVKQEQNELVRCK